MLFNRDLDVKQFITENLSFQEYREGLVNWKIALDDDGEYTMVSEDFEDIANSFLIKLNVSGTELLVHSNSIGLEGDTTFEKVNAFIDNLEDMYFNSESLMELKLRFLEETKLSVSLSESNVKIVDTEKFNEDFTKALLSYDSFIKSIYGLELSTGEKVTANLLPYTLIIEGIGNRLLDVSIRKDGNQVIQFTTEELDKVIDIYNEDVYYLEVANDENISMIQDLLHKFKFSYNLIVEFIVNTALEVARNEPKYNNYLDIFNEELQTSENNLEEVHGLIEKVLIHKGKLDKLIKLESFTNPLDSSKSYEDQVNGYHLLLDVKSDVEGTEVNLSIETEDSQIYQINIYSDDDDIDYSGKIGDFDYQELFYNDNGKLLAESVDALVLRFVDSTINQYFNN